MPLPPPLPAPGTSSLVDPGLSLRHLVCRIELTRPCQGGRGLTVMLPNAGCPADNIQQVPNPGRFCHPGQPFLFSPAQTRRVVPSPTGLPSKRGPGLGSFSRADRGIGGWSGLPCPPPGALPNPGIKPRSPSLQADSLPAKPQGKPIQ